MLTALVVAALPVPGFSIVAIGQGSASGLHLRGTIPLPPRRTAAVASSALHTPLDSIAEKPAKPVQLPRYLRSRGVGRFAVLKFT